MGQSFTVVRDGRLSHLSFDISAQQEAIDETEPLIFDFWNADEQGLPDGDPLLTMIFPASDFIANQFVIKTLDLYDNAVMLVHGEKYVFTLSVDNLASIQYRGMYSIRTNSNTDIGYPQGTAVQNHGGLPFTISSGDLSRFEVTVELTPLLMDGFESE